MKISWVLLIGLNIFILSFPESVQSDSNLNNLRLCSEDFCKHVKCLQLLRPNACGQNEVLVKNGSVCGCCDTCAKIIRRDEECGVIITPPGGKPTSKCEEGYQCKEDEDRKTYKCFLLDSHRDDDTPACVRERVRRQEQMTERKVHHNISDIQLIDDLWMPNCDSNGYYTPKQCKKDKCFCVDPKGDRLFGQSEPVFATNMTCLCSVAWSKKKDDEGNKWLTNNREHCTANGNFAELQCVDDICYCVDEMTGETQSRVVKENQKDSLPCYKAEDFEDGMYLSNCERQVKIERVLQYTFYLKGITIVRSESLNCDPDGTFSHRQCHDNTCKCVTKKGTSYKSYAMQTQGTKKNSMNCRCARDEMERMEHGGQYPKMTCAGNGNYNHYQDLDVDDFCVDDDGDRISQKIPDGFNKQDEACTDFASSLKL